MKCNKAALDSQQHGTENQGPEYGYRTRVTTAA